MPLVTMNIPLYQAAHELEPLLDQIDDDGCISDDLAEALKVFEGKGLGVTAYILNCEAQAAMIIEASKKMAERAKPIQNRAERLKAYLLDNMKRTGITEIKCSEFIAKLDIGRDESVEIFDINQVPGFFIREPKPVELSADKALIKKAIKDGKEVPGARIVAKDRLTIK